MSALQTGESRADRGETTPGKDLSETLKRAATPVPVRSPENGGALDSRELESTQSTVKGTADPRAAKRRWQLSQWQRRNQARFVLKQEWIGRVDEVREDYFAATLATRARPAESEWAEIEIEEVAPKDRAHLRPGAIFYWVVGYRDEPHGQRVSASSIHFRHMIDPTPEQVAAADARADELVEFLESEA